MKKEKSGEMYSFILWTGERFGLHPVQVNKVINNEWLFTRGRMDDDTQKECL